MKKLFLVVIIDCLLRGTPAFAGEGLSKPIDKQLHDSTSTLHNKLISIVNDLKYKDRAVLEDNLSRTMKAIKTTINVHRKNKNFIP